MSDDERATNDTTSGAGPDAKVRLVAWVHGHVQGVGFRWSTRVNALELGLLGYAKNYPDGRVLVVAEGPRDSCEKLLLWLESPDAPGVVDTVVSSWMDPRGEYSGFERK